MKKPLLTILLLLILLILPYTLLSLDGILNYPHPEPGDSQVVGIIYGNRIEHDGSPSERVRTRLDTGYELYVEDQIEKILVSGGIGKEGFDEATVMGAYLVEKGIPEEDIIVDSDGYTTRQTSENAVALLGTDMQVIGISQWFHIARVKLALRQAGFTDVYGVAPKYVELRDIYSILRELPAYVKYKFYK